MSKHSRKWQKIIWREWRNCNDRYYANHLFDLVAYERAGWEAIVTIVLPGALYGVIAGLLVGLIATNLDVWIEPKKWELIWTEMQAFLLWGLGFGGTIALIMRIVLGRRLTWQAWLARLTPQMSFNWLGKWIKWLVVRLFDKVGNLAEGCGEVLVLLGCLSYGLLFLMLFMLLASVTFIVVFVGLVVWPVAWLFFVWQEEEEIFYPYEHRSWCFWWRGRPHPFETEEALCIAAREEWLEPLHLLEERKKQHGSFDSLITALQSEDWVERFTARHALVVLGGEAMEPLRRIAQDKNSELRRTAVWLLKSIAQDTTSRLKRQAPTLLCPEHLVRYHAHKVRVSWRASFTYYGCRACGQSREFLDWPGEVVAVLDEEMSDERVQEDGVLRVNWLMRRALFDFDQVEIVQASDKQVELFASVQVGNDMDEFRRPRYNKMRCVVASGCHLSENTIRILRSMFGEVIFND